jgi:hypothetical protein
MVEDFKGKNLKSQVKKLKKNFFSSHVYTSLLSMMVNHGFLTAILIFVAKIIIGANFRLIISPKNGKTYPLIKKFKKSKIKQWTGKF